MINSNTPYPSAQPGGNIQGNVGRIVSPYPQLTPYPSISSYRPSSASVGTNTLAFSQPVRPGLRVPLYPRTSVNRNVPPIRPPVPPVGANISPRLPNIRRPTAIYPRPPVARNIPSYRPPTTLVGRDVQPIPQPPRYVRPVSYYNGANSWVGRTTNPPIYRPSSVQYLNPTLNLPMGRLQYPRGLAVPSTG